MTNQRCLYVLLHGPRESHEVILRDLVHPVAAEIRGHPGLDSLFYARFDQPDWQVRFRILGNPEWIDGEVRQRVESRVEPLRQRGLVEGVELAEYQREYERYGGPEGMALAEKVFLHDSLACLDLMEAERQGLLAKSRREFSMVLTERLLDLLEMDRERKLVFYRYGHSWALESGVWKDAELRTLEERYRALTPGLEELFQDKTTDEATLYGGKEPARIARSFLAAMQPVMRDLLATHAAGRISQDPGYLAWSYTHMQCNRLGIDPSGEAILRYFMHRYHQDHPVREA